MSKRGFVYVLDHEYMPDLIKVGCTERSPHERAAELSNHTGVPGPFRVLCYLEVEDFQAVERALHDFLADDRIEAGREFFSCCVGAAVGYLYFHPRRLGFCDCTAVNTDPDPHSLLEAEVLFGPVHGLANPWKPDETSADKPAALQLVVNAGDDFE